MLILLLGGSLWLARKWAPNHLNRGLAWSRVQIVTKYPVLDRWLPQAPGKHPKTVFEPVRPIATASPAPRDVIAASPEPSVAPSPRVPSQAGPAIDIVVGAGTEAKVGQTVEVRYSGTPLLKAPERFMIGASEVDTALEAAVRGMKVGGQRKLGDSQIELVKVL